MMQSAIALEQEFKEQTRSGPGSGSGSQKGQQKRPREEVEPSGLRKGNKKEKGPQQYGPQ